MAMNSKSVLELCHEHAAAEAEFDIDRVLATLVPAPRFDFFPLAKSMVGWATVEHFYRHQYGEFAKGVVGYQLLGEWTSEDAAIQEYVISVRPERGGGESPASYHVLSIMPVDQGTGRLTGERLYCDDGFVRALLGPVYEQLEPTS
jgi:hypothetical protein